MKSSGLEKDEKIKPNIIKDITVGNVWNSNYIEYKKTAIKIKHYQLKNILKK